MGVPDPIDELLSLSKQQQIAKLFRFGTPEEIELFEQSVATQKTKSMGDNPTNQRENHLKDQKKLKRLRKKIKSAERKAIKAKRLKKKRLHHQIKKRKLMEIEWHENTPQELKETIISIIKDLNKRKGYYVASELKAILEKYQDTIGKEKFDIGRMEGIEYKIRMKPNVKPWLKQPHNLSPEQEDFVTNPGLFISKVHFD